MLSRVAQSLYWLGRHTERADCLARMLDTYLPFSQRAGVTANRVLGALADTYVEDCAVTDPDTGAVETPPEALRGLIYDRESPSAIAGSLTAARENARGVRDYLPLEIWECLNVTWHGLRGRTPAPSGPHGFLRWVGERCAMTAGLVNEVMSRDEGWHFLAVGRGLERADMTIRMLVADDPAEWSPSEAWAAVNAIGGWQYFLRQHQPGATTTAPAAFDFALLDPVFPRSVLQALRGAEQSLSELDATHPQRTRLMNSARRIVAQARTALDYRTASSKPGEIPVLLEALQTTIDEAHDALASRHFAVSNVSWASIVADIIPEGTP